MDLETQHLKRTGPPRTIVNGLCTDAQAVRISTRYTAQQPGDKGKSGATRS
jgi:hypothetical protein